MRLGIIADEFFSEEVGRMGGFGWAAMQVAQLFNQRPDLGVSVVFLAATLRRNNGKSRSQVHDTPLIFFTPKAGYRDHILRQEVDLVLTVDYRQSYSRILNIINRTPIIVWVRDPKPPAEQAFINTLRLPHDSSTRPLGIKAIDCTSLSSFSNPGARPLLFGTPSPELGDLIEVTFGIANSDCSFLPNIVETRISKITKSTTPQVIFLGRLDPIKRPWLFVELARRFPAVEFLMLGKSHFHGPGSWSINEAPANLKLLGHIDGEQKHQLLSSAWLLVNTSIHEGLANSFLEALACETPLLSCNNREGVTSRFGIYTGRCPGDGMSGLFAFADGLEQLIEDKDRRTRLGQEGRQWVEQTHNRTMFLSSFDKLCTRAGVN